MKVEISPSSCLVPRSTVTVFLLPSSRRPPSTSMFADSIEINVEYFGFARNILKNTSICMKNQSPPPPALSPESFITGGHFRRYQMCQTFTLITPSDGSPGFNGGNLSVPRRLPKAPTITMGGEEDDEEGMNKIWF